jgi:acetyltransferase-like isoleucine patch superfamily enzyme
MFFGFRIGRRVRIGVALLDCSDLSIDDDARIGHGVVFLRTGAVHVGEHASIGPLNVFRGGTRVELGSYSSLLRLNVVNAIPDHDCVGHPESTFSLGYGAIITASHWIDCTDRVSLGRRSILGGRHSSIWTHNRRRSAPVSIGDYCYVGSEVRVAPGVRIADCTIVGLGSVVSNSLERTFTLAAGSPARVVRALTESDADTLFGKTRPDLPDEPVPSIPTERERVV